MQRLLAQWLNVHAFVLNQGLQENEVSALLANDSGTDTPEDGWVDVEPARRAFVRPAPRQGGGRTRGLRRQGSRRVR